MLLPLPEKMGMRMLSSFLQLKLAQSDGAWQLQSLCFSITSCEVVCICGCGLYLFYNSHILVRQDSCMRPSYANVAISISTEPLTTG